MESTTTIWFDRGRENFYAIPEETELPEGELKLHNLRGQVWRVTPESVAGYALSREVATEQVSARIESAWGDLRGAWSRLLDMGQQTAGAAGVELSGENRPELPEELASLLGMAPGELLTEPGVIRSRIRKAMFGEEDEEAAAEPAPEKPEEPAVEEPAIEEPTVEEPAVEEAEEATEADEEAPEPVNLEELARKAEETMRGVLNSPEFGSAIAGIGSFLRRTGQKLQEKAENLERDSDREETGGEEA